MMIASSCAPLSVTASLSVVPVRLPVSTLLIAGVPRAEMLPLATTLSMSVPPPRLIVLESRQLRGGHRHGVVAAASGQRLDAGNRTQREVDGGAAARQHDLVARPAAAVGAALDDSPATNWPLARLIVSSPPRLRQSDDRVGARDARR